MEWKYRIYIGTFFSKKKPTHTLLFIDTYISMFVPNLYLCVKIQLVGENFVVIDSKPHKPHVINIDFLSLSKRSNEYGK